MQYRTTVWTICTDLVLGAVHIVLAIATILQLRIDVTITVLTYTHKCVRGNSIVHHLLALSVFAPTYWTSSLSFPCQVAWTITRVIT